MKKYVGHLLYTFLTALAAMPVTALYWMMSFEKLEFTFQNVAGTMLIGSALGFIPCLGMAILFTYIKMLKEAK